MVDQWFLTQAKAEQEQLGGEPEKKKRKVRLPLMANSRRLLYLMFYFVETEDDE